MIIQLGVIFGGIESALASGLSSIGSLASSAIRQAVPAIAQGAINVGSQYVTGLVSRELNRSAQNDIIDAIKADLRASTNAISPTVAPGQTAVFSGGPPTGSAFRPPTLIPPSTEPYYRTLQIDPGLVNPVVSNSFAQSRRMPGAFVDPSTVGGLAGPVPLTQAQLGPLIRLGGKLLGRGGTVARQFDPRTPLGRQMLGTAAGGVAVEAGAATALDFAFPSTADAPSFGSFPTSGDPLRIPEEYVPATATIPTGLPALGRYQKEANGIRVQWYFYNGNQMLPIDRHMADQVKRESIYRRDVFLGKYIRLKSRRMNPMNVRAFFRAGRRVDAGERICRKMFSEKRKQKTGTVRRKSRKRKK